MATLQEIQPGIFLVTERGGWGPMRPPMNLYVLTGEDGLLYEAGYGTRGSVRYLAREIRRIEAHCRDRGEPCSIRRVLPSHAHPDHFSGLAALRYRLGLRILLTRPMLETIGSRERYRASYRTERGDRNALVRFIAACVVDPAASWFYEKLYGTRFVDDPDEIIGDSGVMAIGGRAWRLVATPGHSPDHLSLYDEGSGILLGGDNVLRSVTTWLGPPKSDLKIYIQTLERIRALPNLRLILGAHGSPVENPRERVAEIIEWRRQRLEHVHQAVKKSGGAGISKAGVVRDIYRGEGAVKRYMADGWVDLSLAYLLEEGRIREVSPGRYAASTGHGGAVNRKNVR
ncbi:MAG TPA: MBL fold metallo-hydrolase [Spirochaetota bacterium]|nr:MBL fold metallo-hydrolase [Spirochaetota bacterium]HPC42276.1 MBL fold metallo-hydrolase [Spirochaetota bacterium]HPL16653.1 MBL fold metallo-hydrolase [Spirochaetota bacterium]HQF09981.1 MBL fold metallo-hydrolase [Spirochaetota bacterium]HQH98686.1 MBL fold metallo-hydrolase [Spirochaetota bacterium]